MQQSLQAAGIPTAVHYPIPIHRQPAYEHLHDGSPVAVSERLAEEVMSLPMHADLDAETQDRIVSELRRGVLS